MLFVQAAQSVKQFVPNVFARVSLLDAYTR